MSSNDPSSPAPRMHPLMHAPSTPEFQAAIKVWLEAQAAHEDAFAKLQSVGPELSPKLESLTCQVAVTGTLVDLALEAVARAAMSGR